jgi:branched-subunit amino acid transport protein
VNDDVAQLTPSLVSGILRYAKWVVLAVAVAALLGGAYASRTWTPQAELSVSVNVVTGAETSSSDADRATAEVAAELGSPAVIARTEAKSGTSEVEVSAFAAQGQSTVQVAVTAPTEEAATAAANSLLDAYREVDRERRQAESSRLIAELDASLEVLNAQLSVVSVELNAIPATTPQAGQLTAQRDALLQRIQNLAGQRDTALLGSIGEPIGVLLAAGPDPGASVTARALRFVPAAVVAALALSALVIAIRARRHPWLTDVDAGATALGAPLLGSVTRERPLTDVAGVAAAAVLSQVPHDRVALVGVLPAGLGQDERPSRRLVAGSYPFADAVAAAAVWFGTATAVLRVGAAGGEVVVVPGEEPVPVGPLPFDAIREPEVLIDLLDARGVKADLIVIAIGAGAERMTVLEIAATTDVNLALVANGMALSGLVELRRNLAAVDAQLIGVVADVQPG